MRVLSVLLAVILFAPPALAQQSIRAAIDHGGVMAAAEQPQAQQPARKRARFWAGAALASAGSLVAILGATVVKSDRTTSGNAPDSAFASCEALKTNPVYAGNQCDVLKGPNPAMVWGGLAAAAAGLLVMTTGASHSSVSIGPTAVHVRHRVKF